MHRVALRNVPFDEQERVLYELLELPTLRRACIDNSGLGRQLIERAQKRFGTYKVEPVTFTLATKEELAYPLNAAFEDHTVRIPDDPKIIASHRAVRKETTASGNVRFVAESTEAGHADDFWAHALALHAAKTPATGAITPETTGAYPLRGNSSSTLLRSKARIHSKDASAKAKTRIFRDIKPLVGNADICSNASNHFPPLPTKDLINFQKSSTVTAKRKQTANDR